MIQNSFQSMWNELMVAAPSILFAIIIIIVGFIVGGFGKRLVMHLIEKLRIDEAINKTGAQSIVERAGYTLNTGVFLGTLVKWFVVTAFFVVALDAVNLHMATEFLRDMVLGYLPRVFVATVILFGAIILAHVVEKGVVAAGKAANFRASAFLGRFAKIAILTSAVLAALNQLQIATELVQMLFGGIVFALALALGLSFGLGGKETASRYIDSIVSSRKN